MIRETIAKLIERVDLTEHEAQAAMGEIMRGEATPAQIAAFVSALRMKGEKVPEIVGCARAMRASALKVDCHRQPLVDTCGTGGDASGTFNISTIAALVLAGAGVAVAKHGNRSVSSRCGSADLLEALGVKIDLGPEEVARCIDEIGIGFLFAQRLHPAMRYAASARREIGIRTIFNILGPLTNPAGATAQLIGTYSASLIMTIAEVLKLLGTKRAMVVHGHSGLDELSTTGPSQVAYLNNQISRYELHPVKLGLRIVPIEVLRGGSPQENAAIALEVLQGRTGPQRDIVLLNAAAGLVVGGRAENIADGLEIATNSIDSGKALDKLKALISLTRRLTGGTG
ncbi:MAG: anthranilate phosphoribosyltransferase [Dehalococcoidia bacterium]|nr:anthranilate phosphoribosyltransferase [Dehalococcoidia bacterium]